MDLMDKISNIRSIAIIGHFNHGKRTLMDGLVNTFGIIIENHIRSFERDNQHIDDYDRLHPPRILDLLYYEMSEETMPLIHSEKCGYLIYGISAPTNNDSSIDYGLLN